MFIGWGSQPYFSEFSATGELLVDGQFESWTRSYRTFLGEWQGKPRDKPVMLAHTEPENLNSFVVYASWNGATEIDHWTVFAGSDAASLKPIASQTWSGFEDDDRRQQRGPGLRGRRDRPRRQRAWTLRSDLRLRPRPETTQSPPTYRHDANDEKPWQHT